MVKLTKVAAIKTLIIELRGKRIILDSDLAKIYGVSTKRLNEQVRRNLHRFPDDFMFQLTEEEKEEVVAFCDHLKKLKYSYQLPYAFTRNGANMLSAILNSPLAVQRSIQIMRAFSTIEELIGRARRKLMASPKIISQLSTHSRAIMHLFQRDRMNSRETAKIKKIIGEMIGVLKQMVFRDIE